MSAPWEMDWADRPADVDSLIRGASERYDIPEDRLRAVVSAESNFDPQAVSKAGAQGLMQLMPATQRDLGVTDPFDPQQNIDGGARYLRAQYDRFGNWDDAHAAYNFGPGNVAKGRPLPDETRGYLAKINASVGADEAKVPWQMDWEAPKADAAPWDMAWGSKPEKAAESPWEMPWHADAKPDEAPKVRPIEDVLGELSSMPFAERAARIAGGLPAGAVETAVQMAAQIPQMAFQVGGFAKALSEGKITREDFDQATDSITPGWVKRLATADELQPETYAGALMAHGVGEAFSAAGRSLAAPAGGIAAVKDVLAGGDRASAQRAFTEEYGRVSPITEQLLNAGVLGKMGAEAAHALRPAEVAKPVDPVADAVPVMKAGSVDEAIQAASAAVDAPAEATRFRWPGNPETLNDADAAIQRAIDLSDETGVEHRAQIEGDDIGVAPVETPLEPRAEDVNARALENPLPETPAPEAEAAPEAPGEPHVDQNDATANAAAREYLGQENDRGNAELPQPAAPIESRGQGADVGAGDHQLGPGEVAPNPRTALEQVAAVAQSIREAAPAEAAAREPDLTRAVAAARSLGVDQHDVMRAIQGENPARVASEIEERAQAAPEVQNVADEAPHEPASIAAPGPATARVETPAAEMGREGPASARPADLSTPPQAVAPPQYRDYTAPKSDPERGIIKGEIRTFATAKLADAFIKQQRLAGFIPRQVEDGWIASKPVPARSPAQKANDELREPAAEPTAEEVGSAPSSVAAAPEPEVKPAQRTPSPEGVSVSGSPVTAESKGQRFPVADVAEAQTPAFAREAGAGERFSAKQIKMVLDPIVAKWANGPDLKVLETLGDAPEAVKMENRHQLAQGAGGEPYAFLHEGTAYVIADQVHSLPQAVEGLYHEALGHYGLQGVFGDALHPMLQQLASGRYTDVAAKAKQYGFDMAIKADRLTAAEEVLAELAQTRPEMGVVKRAVAAIRNFLRDHGVDVKWSDDDIIQKFLLPARRFVEEGKGAGDGTPKATTFHRAYHGSPHDFDKFSTDHIGTGEGAQAYGHGLYFSGRREVAEHYKATLGARAKENDPVLHKRFLQLRDELAKNDELGYDTVGQAIQAIRDHPDWQKRWEVEDPAALQQAFDSYETRKREIKPRLYEVELAPKEGDYLDWDKGLTQQSESVKAALRAVGIAPEGRILDTGKDAYKELAHRAMGADDEFAGRPEARASAILAKAGIPGIKYLDGSSRNVRPQYRGDSAHLAAARDLKENGIPVDDAIGRMMRAYPDAPANELWPAIHEAYDVQPKAHHNYVIFDDKHVEVKAKFARSAENTSEPENVTSSKSLLEEVANLRQQLKEARATGDQGAQIETLQREIGRKLYQAQELAARARAAKQARFKQEETRTGPIRNIGDALAKVFAPATRGEAARETAGIMRANLAKQARDRELGEHQLRLYAKMFDRMSVDRNYAFIDAMEGGKTLEDPRLREAATAIRKLLDDRREQVQALGKGKLDNFIENYFPHIWKDQTKAADFFGRRPLQGSKSFLKERTIDTFREGIEAGLDPISSNPVELALLKAREMDRYIYGQKIFEEMKAAGLAKFVRFGDKAPDGWTKINDAIARVYNKTEEGTVIRGEYYAPDRAATLINNHLSPGLQGNAIFDAWRAAGNAMNSAQLGLGAFHLGFTTLDAMISRVALGIKQTSRGMLKREPGEMVRGIGTTASGFLPWQSLVNLYKGDKLLKSYLGELKDPGLQPIVDALVQGGGRARMDPFYRTQERHALREAIKLKRYGEAARGAIPRLIDAINWPIFEYLVPRQKLGVFFDMAQDALRRNPAMSLEEKRATMGRLWDSVDNRMGEMVYDNLFWNRALKDGLMATVRSVGWNLGTFRELGGGVKDVKGTFKRGELSDRTAYIVGLTFVTAVIGSMTQYLYTGQGPQEAKDLFFPRTGRKRPDGSPDRLSLPSYAKDVYEYVHDVTGFVKHGSDPTHTIKNKLHPLLSTVAQILDNKDFFGNAIRSPGDPLIVQAQDELKYLARQLTPFGIRNYIQQAKLRKEAPSLAGYLTSGQFYGITPAPGYIVHTEAQEESIAISHNRDAQVKKFRQAIKDGDPVAEVQRRMIAAGLSQRDRDYVMRTSSDVQRQRAPKHYSPQ